jgi:hypothetical protein
VSSIDVLVDNRNELAVWVGPVGASVQLAESPCADNGHPHRNTELP